MLLLAIADTLDVRFVDTHDNFGDWSIRDPRQIVKAADVALSGWLEPATDAYLNGWVRHVNVHVINTTTGVRSIYPMELVPYIHPSGASAITLGTLSGDTYTPTNAGLLIGEDGIMVPTGGSAPYLVAGQLLSHYYYNPGDDRMGAQVHLALTIQPGDFLWVIRNGRTKLKYTGSAPALNDPLTYSGATAGCVVSAPAFDGTNTTTAKTTTLRRLLGAAGPEAGSYAVARAAGSDDWVLADLLLPPRFHHTTT